MIGILLVIAGLAGTSLGVPLIKLRLALICVGLILGMFAIALLRVRETPSASIEQVFLRPSSSGNEPSIRSSSCIQLEHVVEA
jgi:hypothetical protein